MCRKMHMEAEHKNTQDIRNGPGLTSVKIKIEKRCLERFGHVMRPPDYNLATLSWISDLKK